jgi:hypothetical protein
VNGAVSVVLVTELVFCLICNLKIFLRFLFLGVFLWLVCVWVEWETPVGWMVRLGSMRLDKGAGWYPGSNFVVKPGD